MTEEKSEEKKRVLPDQVAFRTKGAEELVQEIYAIAKEFGLDASKVLRMAAMEGLPRVIERIADEQAKQAEETRRKLAALREARKKVK